MRTEFELRHFVVGTQGPVRRRIQRARAELLAATDGNEISALTSILNELDGDLIRDDDKTKLEAEEPEYWSWLLNRRAQQEITATGRVSVETQEKLFQIGQPLPCGRDYLRDVENRFIEHCKPRIMIVTPTLLTREEVDAGALKGITQWKVPEGIEVAHQIIQGMPVDMAYNEAVQKAKEWDAHFMLTVEDDHDIPEDTFLKLWDLYRKAGPKCVVGAWYPRRQPGRIGCPIVVADGHRHAMPDDGNIYEAYVIPQGFTLIPMKLFSDVPAPWFAATPILTQDSFFSQVAREAGYSLLVDTNAKIAHIDRKTGERHE